MTRFFGGLFGVALVAAAATAFFASDLMRVKGASVLDLAPIFIGLVVSLSFGVFFWRLGEAIFAKAEGAQ